MNRRYFGILPLFASLLVLLLIAGCGSDSTQSVTDPGGDDPAIRPIWYVDDSATGDGGGRSWENAIVHPSVAMDSASAGDQIWVADGYYFGPGDRHDPVVAFKAGVTLYGGFEGNETDLSQRDQRDQATFDGGDTLYHVVTGADDALLHGISVKNGIAMYTFTSSGMRGGGIYCRNVKMRISNCNISSNEAYYGGGIYAEGDTVVIDSCTITENHSHEVILDESAGGGGINIHTGRAVIDHCGIYDNSSDNHGGGLLLFNSSADVSGSAIARNTITDLNPFGAGAYVYNADALELRTEFVNCSISLNSAHRGAGITAVQAKIGFNDCTFNNNIVTNAGSALHLSHCSYLMEHCIVRNNGACALYTLNPNGPTHARIFNCFFLSNGSNDMLGGAIYQQGDIEIDFCTIAYNRAREGAGIYSVFWSTSTFVSNSIIWGNQSVAGLPQIQNVDGATVFMTYTDIDQIGFDGGGLYNMRIDPLLIPIGMAGNYYLSHIAAGQESDSPCIDAGNGTAISHSLNERTTRTDSVFDTGMADLGFHYKVGY